MPGGKYTLFARHGGPRLVHDFEVPDVNEKLWQRPVDLGVVQLTEDTTPAQNAFKH